MNNNIPGDYPRVCFFALTIFLTTGKLITGTSKAWLGGFGEIANFQYVSNGKSLIASAITDKGVSTASDATFQTMANNISNIKGASKCVSGTMNFNTLSTQFIVTGFDFTPIGFSIFSMLDSYGGTYYYDRLIIAFHWANNAYFGVISYQANVSTIYPLYFETDEYYTLETAVSNGSLIAGFDHMYDMDYGFHGEYQYAIWG